ncbi:MAG: response regulator transcription factor [Roseivirga sp.]|nr:response regulator transcription factor [Roseivirga sp.]
MPSSEPLDIFIVEDELIITESLKRILKNLGHNCAGSARSVLRAENAIQKGSFDLVLLDINLNGNNEGIGLGQLCHKQNQPFLYISSYSDYETVIAAKKTKPGGYLNKPFTPRDLMIGIEMATINRSAENYEQLEKAVRHLDLSEREMDVLKCVKNRLSNTEISNNLSISTNTVKYHLKNLYSKLDVVSRADFLKKIELMTQKN